MKLLIGCIKGKNRLQCCKAKNEQQIDTEIIFLIDFGKSFELMFFQELLSLLKYKTEPTQFGW